MTKQRIIATEIKKNIFIRLYYPGEKLPTESELMEFYNVSRNTIRQTLSTLEAEGYIYTIQGSGYYVRDSDLINSISLKSLDEIPGNDNVINKVISFDIIKADPKYSKLFNIPLNSDLYNFERIRFLNGKAAMIENTVLPALLFPDFSIKDAESSIFSYVEKNTSNKISHSIRKYKGVLLTNDECEKLNVKFPTAATSVVSTGYLKKEIAFEHSKILQIDSSFTAISRRI